MLLFSLSSPSWCPWCLGGSIRFSMVAPMTPEYVVVGHCALDVQPDGSFLPGGTVLYSALTAARMGMRAGILTAGDPVALADALAPFAGSFAIHILPTPTISRRPPDASKRSMDGPDRSSRMHCRRHGGARASSILARLRTNCRPARGPTRLPPIGQAHGRLRRRRDGCAAGVRSPRPFGTIRSCCRIACSTASARWSSPSRSGTWRRRPSGVWRGAG